MRRSFSAASLGAASNDGTGALARPCKSSRGAGEYKQIVVEYEQLLQGLENDVFDLIERTVSVLHEWIQKASYGGTTALTQFVIKAMTFEVGLIEGCDEEQEQSNFNARSKDLDKCLVELMSSKSVAPKDMASVKALRLRVNVITEKTSALCTNRSLNDALRGVTRDRNGESFGPLRDALARRVGLQIADPATVQNITACLTTLEVMTKDIAEETAASDTLEGGYAKSADYVGLAEDIIKLIHTKEKRHNDLTVFFGAAQDVLAVKQAHLDFLECSNEDWLDHDDCLECMVALHASFDYLHDSERVAEREKHADGNDAAKQYMDYFAGIISTVGTVSTDFANAFVEVELSEFQTVFGELDKIKNGMMNGTDWRYGFSDIPAAELTFDMVAEVAGTTILGRAQRSPRGLEISRQQVIAAKAKLIQNVEKVKGETHAGVTAATTAADIALFDADKTIMEAKMLQNLCQDTRGTISSRKLEIRNEFDRMADAKIKVSDLNVHIVQTANDFLAS